MNPRISRLLALIPERSARLASGTRFEPSAAACAHPERIAVVAQLLSWMTPLGALTRDEQLRLGIAATGPRPADAAEEAEDAETEHEEPVA